MEGVGLLARNRDIEVRVVLKNDFQEMEFRHILAQLITKSNMKLRAKVDTYYDKNGRIEKVVVHYKCRSWRKIAHIRARLSRQAHAELEVFCSKEDPKKPGVQRRKRPT